MKKIFIIIIVLILSGFSGFYYFNSSPEKGCDIRFTIPEGEPLGKTAFRLREQGCIKSTVFLKILAYTGRMTTSKAGAYRIYPGSGTFSILKKITRGEVITHSVTIPEGFNIYQISERLEEAGITNKNRFLHFVFDKKFLASLGITATSAEGYLYPDTYVMAADSDPRDIIAHMYNKTKDILKELNGPEEQGQIHRLVTLASLIEEEARLPKERGYISSVFHNRLKRGMRMDCDPTVRYAIKKFDRPLSRKDLAADSPYNTYVNYGLPPGPISSPGKDALMAALKPKKTSYLYFVARNDGSHYFSKSLREHNRAVAYYQRGEKNNFNDKQELEP